MLLGKGMKLLPAPLPQQQQPPFRWVNKRGGRRGNYTLKMYELRIANIRLIRAWVATEIRALRKSQNTRN
jgi:hypothetical protein